MSQEGALVYLGTCTKGSDFIPEPVPLLLNDEVYPDLDTYTLETKVRKDGPTGDVVTSVAVSVVSAPLATIVPFELVYSVTAALDCERLYWSTKGTKSGRKYPFCHGYVPVVPEATY